MQARLAEGWQGEEGDSEEPRLTGKDLASLCALRAYTLDNGPREASKARRCEREAAIRSLTPPDEPRRRGGSSRGSPSERPVSPSWGVAFEDLDANGDGVVDREEWAAHEARSRGPGRPLERGPTSPTVDRQITSPELPPPTPPTECSPQHDPPEGASSAAVAVAKADRRVGQLERQLTRATVRRERDAGSVDLLHRIPDEALGASPS